MKVEAAIPVGFWDTDTSSSITIKPISHSIAQQAVMKYHYSRTMPSASACYGFWEPNVRFIGCIIFGAGATPYLCEPYGLEQQQVWELVRIAFCDHVVPVSQCVALALR